MRHKVKAQLIRTRNFGDVSRDARLKASRKSETMTKDQLMQLMVSAVGVIDKLPKAPKGEAAGKKAIEC